MTTSLDAVQEQLRTEIASILYVEPDEIGNDATFKELGLDSVLGVELVSAINATYGRTETIDTIYEHPTLARLSRYIADEQ